MVLLQYGTDTFVSVWYHRNTDSGNYPVASWYCHNKVLTALCLFAIIAIQILEILKEALVLTGNNRFEYLMLLKFNFVNIMV